MKARRPLTDEAHRQLALAMRASGITPEAYIVQARELPGIEWSRPFMLLRPGFAVFTVVGRFRTREAAEARAHRLGLELLDDRCAGGAP